MPGVCPNPPTQCIDADIGPENSSSLYHPCDLDDRSTASHKKPSPIAWDLAKPYPGMIGKCHMQGVRFWIFLRSPFRINPNGNVNYDGRFQAE
ncbi:MAG: hypothetical protein ABSD96_22205, partial [Candidatus Korobacteraceae bacterium]